MEIQEAQKRFVPNREAINLATTIPNNAAFTSQHALMVFKDNRVDDISGLKESAEELIAQTRRLLDLIPK